MVYSGLALSLGLNARLIGLLYFIFGCCAGLLAFGFSFLLRAELAGLGEQLVFGDQQFYYVSITSHAQLMIFFFVQPSLLSGFSNLFVPCLLGVPEMVFPRLNHLGLFILPFGFFSLVGSGLFDEGAGSAWTMYPPLVGASFHGGLSVDFFSSSLGFVALSSSLGGLNLLGTLLFCRRAHFMVFSVGCLLLCSFFGVSVLLLVILPVLLGCVSMVLLDRCLNTVFFDVSAGGDVVLFQHLFWVFGHPEVYVIILPAFGVVSHILGSFWGGGSLVSQLSLVFALFCISWVGFFVWAHHLFTVGLDLDARVFFSAASLVIALPTSIKVFSWLVTLLRVAVVSSVLLLVGCFLLMFSLGGITGLILANCDIDQVCHDSFFVVAHFHFVLSLGAVFGFLSGGFFTYFQFVSFFGGYSVRLVVLFLVFGSSCIF